MVIYGESKNSWRYTEVPIMPEFSSNNFSNYMSNYLFLNENVEMRIFLK